MTSGRKGRPGKRGVPGPEVVQYRGPIRESGGSVPDDGVIVRLSLANNATGTTGGMYYATNNLGVTSASDWANMSATFDEYRVLGFELDYLPNAPEGNSTFAHSAGFKFVTHSADAYVNPSIDVCVQHADWKPVHTGDYFNCVWKMAGVEEAMFISTAAPSTQVLGSIFATFPFATTASSSVYGIFVNTWVVQFRGRK